MLIVRYLLSPLQPLSWVGAAIAAASALASAAASSKAGSSSATKQGRQFSLDMYKRELSDSNTKLQRTVKDAQSAGLHPLFALGSSANYSPTAQTPSGSPSVGHEGIAAAGRAIGQGVDQHRADAKSKLARQQSLRMGEAQIKLAEQTIQKNDIDLLAANSATAIYQREMATSPMKAQAFSDAAFEAMKQKPIDDAARRERAVRIQPNEVLYGPKGGEYPLPAGTTPAQVWEDVAGEVGGEVMGAGTFAHAALTESEKVRFSKKMRGRTRNQVNAALRSIRGKKRASKPFNRFIRWLKK